MAFLVAAADFALASANDNESMATFLLTVRGQAAALAGVGLGGNPYPPDTDEGARWAAGWMAGILELDESPRGIRKVGRSHRGTLLRTIGLDQPTPVFR